MHVKKSRFAAGIALGLLCGFAPAAVAQVTESAPEPSALREQFRQAHPGVRLQATDELVEKVYGRAFMFGESVQATAEAFRTAHAPMLGVPAEDLAPVVDHLEGTNMIGVMPDPATGEYRFTVVYYTQMRGGVDVFGSRVALLVRNDGGHPLTLANVQVRPLGDFEVAAAVREAPMNPAAEAAVAARFGEGAEILETGKTIWAGVGEEVLEPRLADEIMLRVGVEEWLVLTDARTGAMLYQQRLTCEGTSGTVSGLVTEDVGADFCEPESAVGLPYLTVTSSESTTFTDADGHFELPAVLGPVQASLDGQWFDVTTHTGQDVDESTTGAAPANILFNAENTSEAVRAQVNAYQAANRVRDWVLAYHPDYPTLDEGDFEVNVNRTDGFCPCNAWYSPGGPSINFCLAESGCANTGFGSVVFHEYGHHLVNAGGSGQGPYGEGMSDTISALLLDDPHLAIGFFGSCDGALRTADNDCQYLVSGCSTCGSESHACGNLLSGCIWDSRQLLQDAIGDDALDVMRTLTLSSILLHEGSSIEPDILIDFLTLDDDNADLSDGTPHGDALVGGFLLHGMSAPEVAPIQFTFPDGLPEVVSPSGTTTVTVRVEPLFGEPLPGSAVLMLDAGDGFEPIPLLATAEPHEYEAVVPPLPCGAGIEYFFIAESTSGIEVAHPFHAPFSVLSALVAEDATVAFADDFEMDLGWTVANSPGLTDGAWDMAVPAGGGDRGDPATDADGSGQCYLTNSADGNTDVDNGSTTLVSPVLDASVDNAMIRYHRWFSNHVGDNPHQDSFVVEVSDDGGATWHDLEIVGPGGSEAEGGWYLAQFMVAEISGVEPTDEFRVRFTAADLGGGSVVEAAVDGVEVISVACEGGGPTPDLDGSGTVGVGDLLILLGQWGTCPGGGPCAADLTEDGSVDVGDLLELLGAWGAA